MEKNICFYIRFESKYTAEAQICYKNKRF
jgi:hypothetical protein